MAESLGMSSAILTLCQAVSATIKEIRKLCKYYREGTKQLRRLLRYLAFSTSVCDEITELLEKPDVRTTLCDSTSSASRRLIEDYMSDLSDISHLLDKLQKSASTSQIRLAKDLRFNESDIKEHRQDVNEYNAALNTLMNIVCVKQVQDCNDNVQRGNEQNYKLGSCIQDLRECVTRRSPWTSLQGSSRKDRQRRNSTISQFAQVAEDIYTANRTTSGTPKIGSFPRQSSWDMPLPKKSSTLVEDDSSEEEDPNVQPIRRQTSWDVLLSQTPSRLAENGLLEEENPNAQPIRRQTSWDVLLSQIPSKLAGNNLPEEENPSAQPLLKGRQSEPGQGVATADNGNDSPQESQQTSTQTIAKPQVATHGVRMPFAPPRPTESPFKPNGTRSCALASRKNNQSEKWLTFKKDSRDKACELVRKHEYQTAIGWLNTIRGPLLESMRRDANHQEDRFLKDYELEKSCVIGQELTQVRLMITACYLLMGDYDIAEETLRLGSRMGSMTVYHSCIVVHGVAVGHYFEGNFHQALDLGKVSMRYRHRMLKETEISPFDCWEAERFVAMCHSALGDEEASEDIKKNWTYEPKYVEPTSLVDWIKRQSRFFEEVFDGQPPKFDLPPMTTDQEEPSFWKLDPKHTNVDESPGVSSSRETSLKCNAPPLIEKMEDQESSPSKEPRWSLRRFLSSKRNRESAASRALGPPEPIQDRHAEGFEISPRASTEWKDTDPDVRMHLSNMPDYEEIILHELSRCDFACRKKGVSPPVKDTATPQKPQNDWESHKTSGTEHSVASKNIVHTTGAELHNGCNIRSRHSKRGERKSFGNSLGVVGQTSAYIPPAHDPDFKRGSEVSIDDSGYASSSERDSGCWPHPLQPGLQLREGDMF